MTQRIELDVKKIQMGQKRHITRSFFGCGAGTALVFSEDLYYTMTRMVCMQLGQAYGAS